MVMEKALPHLPEELVKNIEELAGIYRQPGYKELSESLKFLSSSNATVLLDRKTFVPKPKGRPRKGKVWHPKKGCWVDNGCPMMKNRDGLLLFRVGTRNSKAKGAHVSRLRAVEGMILYGPMSNTNYIMQPSFILECRYQR
jgi:hypothetical protein